MSSDNKESCSFEVNMTDNSRSSRIFTFHKQSGSPQIMLTLSFCVMDCRAPPPISQPGSLYRLVIQVASYHWASLWFPSTSWHSQRPMSCFSERRIWRQTPTLAVFPWISKSSDPAKQDKPNPPCGEVDPMFTGSTLCLQYQPWPQTYIEIP